MTEDHCPEGAFAAYLFGCEILNGVCVDDAHVLILREHRAPIGTVATDALVERGAVFKRGVHPLSEEWHHRVRRITEQRDFASDVPRRTTHRGESAGGVCEKIGVKCWHEPNGVGKFSCKKFCKMIV